MTIHAAGHDGAAIANLPLTVRVVSDYYDNTPESDAVPPQAAVTDGQGNAQVTFTGVPQGWYRIVAAGSDGRGQPVEAVTWLWVRDPNSQVWWYASSDQLRLMLDKESYAPGETAHVLIQSRVTGMALLTVEREQILVERVISIDGPMTTVDVPIADGYTPNVFLKLHIFKRTGPDESGEHREGRLLTAQIEAPVPAVSKRLTVDIVADAAQYAAGGQATLTVHVSDAAGNPTAGRVGLALVDEALFALQKDLSADLFDTFYGPRGNSVLAYDTLARNPYLYLYPAPGVPTSAPDAGIPEPGAGQSAPTLRRNFLDTAYWNPAIDVGADGTAVVTVPLPDNLTTWRVIARAVTLDTRVGEAREQLLVTQPVIARPALPRFAVVGDRFRAGLVGQNYTGADIGATATLAADGLVLLDGAQRALYLPNNGSVALHWTAVAATPGTGFVTATLATAGGGDAVETPLPVKPFAAPDRWTAAGMANPLAVVPFAMPANAIGDASQLIVRLSPSLALGVLDGLDELIDYPYGCIEQTMSRILPSAVAARTYRELGLPNPKADELPDVINLGLQKIYGFQHGNGGWGWFYDDDDNIYMTAYVLYGLTTVQQAGFEVDAGVLNRGFTLLNSLLGEAGDPNILAFARYVFATAGRGDLNADRALLGQLDNLDAAALAFLALTLQQDGDAGAAQTTLDRLLALAQDNGITAYWPAPRDSWNWWQWRTMTSDAKNTALAVRALTALRPGDPLTAKGVRWLMEHRRGAGWGDTQATAFAVLALLDMVKASGEQQANYAYSVELNGKPIANGQVTPQTVTQPLAPIVVAGSQLRLGENELRIVRAGEAESASQPADVGASQSPLYYTVLLQRALFYDGFTPVSSADQGLKLTRAYRLLEGAPRPDGAYNVGDVVEVALTLEARTAAEFVIVQDPIPAGFEALNERMNQIGYGYAWPLFGWRDWGYNRKDVRDDRVDFFITAVEPGQQVMTYQMRATTPGEFSVLPGQAYPMYADAIWGRSASTRIVVAPDLLADRRSLIGDFDRSCTLTEFDTRLLASAFGSNRPERDIYADGVVDLRDVVAVDGRRGATCAAESDGAWRRRRPGQLHDRGRRQDHRHRPDSERGCPRWIRAKCGRFWADIGLRRLRAGSGRRDVEPGAWRGVAARSLSR